MGVRLSVLLMLLTANSIGDAQEQAAMPQHNLVTFFNKCRAGEAVTIAYIGGSVTSGSWRPFTTQWIRQQFNGLEVKEINAAIGGTGSELGVFRLHKHVLQHNPDLLFVEFAINDRATPDEKVLATMEGIVRQAWGGDKKPDMVFCFTTHGKLDCPMHRHKAVADAYGIPTVDFQRVIKAVCEPGFIDWPVLAPDNVHPNDWGHSIYAATLATFLKEQMTLTEPAPPLINLPPAKFSDKYASARLMPVTFNIPEGWEILKPEGKFEDGAILAKEAGRSIEFRFQGMLVGLYYEMLKDAPFIACEIDGKAAKELDASWGPTYRFNRHSYVIIHDGLPKGEHVLKITVLDKKHDLSEGHLFKLGYLMLAG